MPRRSASPLWSSLVLDRSAAASLQDQIVGYFRDAALSGRRGDLLAERPPNWRHDQRPGSATAPAVRIGWGMDHQFDQYWSAGFKVGIQHTGSAECETTSEPFRFDHKNEVIFGLNPTHTLAGN